MPQSLSPANQSNLAAAYADPAVLVEIPGISKQWASDGQAGYDDSLKDVTALRRSLPPGGGLAELSDFTVTLDEESLPQWIQTLDTELEPIHVYLQFGSDEKIRLQSGVVETWEYESSEVRLNCSSEPVLADQQLPTVQVNRDESSSFLVPDASVGQWVPITIGRVETAKGVLVDRTTSAQKAKFNAELSGHDALSTLHEARVYVPSVERFLEVGSTASAETAGHYELQNDQFTRDGRVHLIFRSVPVSGGNVNISGALNISAAGNAVDEDFSTRTTADGGSGTVQLRGQLRDFRFPEEFQVITDSIYVLADLNRSDPIDTAAGEKAEAFFLRDSNTPPTGSTSVDVLADTESALDNLNTQVDAETAVNFSTADYLDAWGVDTDNDGTPDVLPVGRFSGTDFTLEYKADDSADEETLWINEWRARIDLKVEVESRNFYGDVEGYADASETIYSGQTSPETGNVFVSGDELDGTVIVSGQDVDTYTSDGALIETPSDVVKFMLGELLGQTAFDDAAFTDARICLSDYKLAGQVLENTGAREVFRELARQGRLKLFRNFRDEWTVKLADLPYAEDRRLDAGSGDLSTGSEAPGAHEGEIVRVTQTPPSDIFTQFEILYAWNEATRGFDERLQLDETTDGPIGDWLSAHQDRYGVTRKKRVEARWIRDRATAKSYGIHQIYLHAQPRRIVTYRQSFNGFDTQLGDRVRLDHRDLEAVEGSTIHSGYVTDDSGTVANAGFTDPDTSSTVTAGADVELFEGRHIYEVGEVELDPMEGTVQATARQVDVTRSQIPDPVMGATRPGRPPYLTAEQQ